MLHRFNRRDLLEPLKGRLKPRETQEPATLGEARMACVVLGLPLVPSPALQRGLDTLATALGASGTTTRHILSELMFYSLLKCMMDI